MFKKIDFLDVGGTLSDRDRRYEFGRKIDFLDVGTPLGKTKFIQSIDFLDMFPKPATGDSIMLHHRSNPINMQANKYINELNMLRTSDTTGKLAYFYENASKALSENKQDIC